MFWLAYGEYRGRREIRPFLRYYTARLKAYTQERSYRIYVTDSLRAIPQESWIVSRWVEILDGNAHKEQTADEIIEGIAERGGIIME